MIVLGVVLLALGILAVVYQRVDARSQEDRARRADVIIVLGSAVYPGERPSPSLNARVQHAIALYRAGYATHLILCGGLGTYPPSEAEVMRRLAASAVCRRTRSCWRIVPIRRKKTWRTPKR
jgi:vancomycin permeability regulator SanA